MPRGKWKPTPEYYHRNRWLNKTNGIALRELKYRHQDEFARILSETRRIIPYIAPEPEAKDKNG